MLLAFPPLQKQHNCFQASIFPTQRSYFLSQTGISSQYQTPYLFLAYQPPLQFWNHLSHQYNLLHLSRPTSHLWAPAASTFNEWDKKLWRQEGKFSFLFTAGIVSSRREKKKMSVFLPPYDGSHWNYIVRVTWDNSSKLSFMSERTAGPDCIWEAEKPYDLPVSIQFCCLE